MNIGFSQEKLTDLFLNGRKKVLRIAIIALSLFIALIVYISQTKNIESLRIREDMERKKNDVLGEIARSEKTIKLYKNMLSQKDALSVMNVLGNIAKESNVTLVSIKPANEENRPLYIKFPFVLVIAADNYHAMGKFISKIENEPGNYSVDAINIRPQEESRGPDRELTKGAKPAKKLILNLILSIIAFKG